jgi:exopolyphosphatase/guanosine-5'-triphosphate,3'-diphosphate pyrophosphatase
MNLVNAPLAVIDLGTNSFQLEIAKLVSANKLEIIHRQRNIFRLRDFGDHLSTEIASDKFEPAIAILKNFKQSALAYDAEIFITATSAVRDAANNGDFIAKVANETGLHIKILSGEDEAAFIYSGVQHKLNFPDKNVFVIDIGGGSTEIILGNTRDIFYKSSVPVGVVRCANKFFPGYVTHQAGEKKLNNYLRDAFRDLPAVLHSFPCDLFIGTSGAVRNSIFLCQQDKNEQFPAVLRFHELKEMCDRVRALTTPESRNGLLPVDPGRTDVLPVSLFILHYIMDLLHIESLQYSDYALREGLLFSYFNKFRTDS